MTDRTLETPFTRHAGVEVPLICGPMYPCSNPELVAAASEAGALGVLQPVSLTYVHGHDFREGVRLIRSLTSKPIGMNALIEASSRTYLQRMRRWIDIAIEEGVRFFITSLGNPRWVVERAHEAGAVVYHDATERKWGQKGVGAGVDGLIAVNARAGGHAGERNTEDLLEELGDLGVPVVCAGGIGAPEQFAAALELGYDGVQCGTRFIATLECNASEAYKRAILEAEEEDIVLSERLTGVPVAVIETPFIERMGTEAGPIAKRLLRCRRTKHLMRAFYTLRAARSLKKASLDPKGSREYWQAGKSAGSIEEIRSVAEIVDAFATAARRTLWLLLMILSLAIPREATAQEPAAATAACDRFEGSVTAGQTFESERPSGLDFVLDPEGHPANPPGWTIRLFLHDDHERDLVRYATPPFRSSNPRYLDTSYGLSAQDAVAWSPREFSYVTSAIDHDLLGDAVAALAWPHDYADETLEEVRRGWEDVTKGRGRLWIIDSEINPPDPTAPRGRIERLAFEVELCPPSPSDRGPS